MLNNKIKLWKLGKKNTEAEMRTAIYVLAQIGYNGRNRPAGELSFSIREREVPFDEIMRYYHRKDILDPFEWLVAQPAGFQLVPDVVLLPPLNAGLPSDFEVTDALDDLSDDAPSSQSRSSGVSDNTTQTSSGQRDLSIVPSDSLGSVLQSPKQYRNVEQLVNIAKSYCREYLHSPRAQADDEPAVHHFTVHGQFGHKIQDGIAAVLYQGDLRQSRVHLRSASSLLPTLLQRCHPMGLAQLFAVLCEMVTRAAAPRTTLLEIQKQKWLHNLLKWFVQHISKISAEHLGSGHPVREMFKVLDSTGQTADLVLAVMHSMVDSFADAELPISDASYWKLLYLQERYCDCLYHSGTAGEGQARRAQLLEEQQDYYGKTKGNVLWTLTNVADDHLHNHQPGDAEKLFKDALGRADSLEHYGRAKTRFAALEGLAKTAQWRARNSLAHDRPDRSASSSAITESPVNRRVALLLEADSFCNEAEREASQWFGSDSRRTVQIAKKRGEISFDMHKILQTMSGLKL